MPGTQSPTPMCTCKKQLGFVTIIVVATIVTWIQYWMKPPLLSGYSLSHQPIKSLLTDPDPDHKSTVSDLSPFVPTETFVTTENLDKDSWGKLTFGKNTTGGENPRRPKLILLWNDNFGMKDWDIGLGQTPFQRCPITTSCYITNNRSDASESAAVLFHVNELYTQDRPWRRRQQRRQRGQRGRREEQRWVFFNVESPLFQFWQNRAYRRWDGWFNWTMTYRRDSDVWVKYGDVVEREEEEGEGGRSPNPAAAPAAAPAEKLRYRLKEKTAVWMVSNCKSPSKRWKLYEQLSKHIDIDIVGNCGPTKCNRTKSTENACMRQLGRKYKFYLAFENALCRDYLTEKPYEPLRYGLVPIVYGLGDYTAALPRGSFINAQDYRSMEELANYLKTFTSDRDSKRRYRKFFTWRRRYRVVGSREAYWQSWCKLCERLHEPIVEKVYSNITDWWNKTGTCVPAKDMLKQWNL